MKDDDPNRFVCDTCHQVIALYPSKELRVIPCGHCLTGRLICQGTVKKQVRFDAFVRLLAKVEVAYRAHNEDGYNPPPVEDVKLPSPPPPPPPKTHK